MTHSLRADARAIWQAGVSAVDSERLVREHLMATDDELVVCGQRYRLSDVDRLIVVGGGKAGAGMAAGVESVVEGTAWGPLLTGWLNVPADCVRPLGRIYLHAARPAGVNEPTEAGVAGSREILTLCGSATPRDLVLVLLSGGGSALLPAPRPPVTLADKLAVTRLLSSAGATIHELNTVRKRLSLIKGGGLARVCRGRMATLVISDVIGDPLDVIASGPTVADRAPAGVALEVLRRYLAADSIPPLVLSVLKQDTSEGGPVEGSHHILGNNRTAVDAALRQARRMGYRVADLGSDEGGVAREVGRALADRLLAERPSAGETPVCFVSGGEPVVRLTPGDHPRRGGRNQELVLAAAERLWDEGVDGLIVLSGGTDGEDGPTDAAGGLFDADVHREAHAQGLHPRDFLPWNNSYPFLERSGGLLKTGPTHTNVMDLRVGLVGPPV